MNIATSLTLNANRHPDKMAITCEGRVYSYKEALPRNTSGKILKYQLRESL